MSDKNKKKENKIIVIGPDDKRILLTRKEYNKMLKEIQENRYNTED